MVITKYYFHYDILYMLGQHIVPHLLNMFLYLHYIKTNFLEYFLIYFRHNSMFKEKSESNAAEFSFVHDTCKLKQVSLQKASFILQMHLLDVNKKFEELDMGIKLSQDHDRNLTFSDYSFCMIIYYRHCVFRAEFDSLKQKLYQKYFDLRYMNKQECNST